MSNREMPKPPKEKRPPREKKPRLAPVPLDLCLPPETTLAEARKALKDAMLRAPVAEDGTKKAKNKAGAVCPCCEQQATVYSRRVNRSIVRVMAALDRYRQEHGDLAWANIPKLFRNDPELRGTTASQGGQWAQAEKWGLVEREKGKHREDGSARTGHARITALGVAFLAGMYRIREYALFYNNVLLGKKGEPMRVDDVRDFDYLEIFGGTRPKSSELPDESLYVNKDHFVDVSSLVYGDEKSA